MNREMHVDDLELAAFVDGGLDAETRRRVEIHLLDCEDCRNLVARSAGVLSVRTRRPRRWMLLAGALAASAATVVLMVAPFQDGSEPGPRTRDVEVAGPANIAFAPMAPPDNARIRFDTLSFHWTGAGDQATYQVTVSTEAGAIVWTGRTNDTSLVLPPGVARLLEPGRSYYWQVDAALSDLRSASTGPRRFTPIAP